MTLTTIDKRLMRTLIIRRELLISMLISDIFEEELELIPTIWGETELMLLLEFEINLKNKISESLMKTT